MSGRRKSRNQRPLTRNQIVDAAVKIIGDDRARRDDVQDIVDRMMRACARSERTRSRQSKKQKQFAKQYGAALRKVIAMTRRAPTDFRALPSVTINAPQLNIKNEMFDPEHLLRHLELLHAISESWEKSRLGQPKPDAYEKRLAAGAALHLMRMHDMAPTTTKEGAFCKLAAMLSGDQTADLQRYCREALEKRKSGLKTVPVNAPRPG